MSTVPLTEQKCIIIGASHAGVSAAFSLRKEGWQGEILLIDSDPALPYHRPPLSKAYLTTDASTEPAALKPLASYEKNNISLRLGQKVNSIDRDNNSIELSNGDTLTFDQLIIATGARPFIPPIKGLESAANVFTLRNKADVDGIQAALSKSATKRVVVIGGGYIGLETAASIKKLGGTVTVLERESRLLARVTSPEMSAYFAKLHADNGVMIKTQQNVMAIKTQNGELQVQCDTTQDVADTSEPVEYTADIVIIGVGIRVNQEVAAQANLTIENGIKVNDQCQTNDNNIYAIGDCSFHHNKYYNRWLRLESVQNAVDQSKIAAAAICGKDAQYDALPWFWSDQFTTKLQMVGLATDYDNLVLRKELDDDNKFSVWYFKGETLLSVDTVNHAKAYVIGTKTIKNKLSINKENLANSEVPLTLDNLNSG